MFKVPLTNGSFVEKATATYDVSLKVLANLRHERQTRPPSTHLSHPAETGIAAPADAGAHASPNGLRLVLQLEHQLLLLLPPGVELGVAGGRQRRGRALGVGGGGGRTGLRARALAPLGVDAAHGVPEMDQHLAAQVVQLGDVLRRARVLVVRELGRREARRREVAGGGVGGRTGRPARVAPVEADAWDRERRDGYVQGLRLQRAWRRVRRTCGITAADGA